MQNIIKIQEVGYEILLETPAEATTTVVIFLPGMSGGAFSERFLPVAEACLGAGFAIARVSLWTNAADVQQKSLRQIHIGLDQVVTHLKVLGYQNIMGIGKSFGGAVLLTSPAKDISKKVFWAPAIGCSVSGLAGNINEYLDVPLGSVTSLLEIEVGTDCLNERFESVLFIHGTADSTIPLGNSEKLASLYPQASLFTVEGADHSYNNPDHERIVIKATMDFLQDA